MSGTIAVASPMRFIGDDRKRPHDDYLQLQLPRAKSSRVSTGEIAPSPSKFTSSLSPDRFALTSSRDKENLKPSPVISFRTSSLQRNSHSFPCKLSTTQAVVDLCDGEDANEIGEDASKKYIEEEEIEVVKVRRSKKVTFNEIEHEVKYFTRYPVEEEVPFNNLGTINENEEASGNSNALISSEQSRATADFTVLSSRHGRARRKLRNISKRDLKAAIKYGKREPAHPDRRTGKPRWKFVHNGLVYITDETMRNEITSFQEAVTIDSKQISVEMIDHHIEVKRILREERHLCTGHTFIVIDQSGSMRNSDVNGFVSRSHAAYGTLALDFVSEQLDSNPIKDGLFAESVSVIEMKDTAKTVLQMEPLDWIVFNRICRRPNTTRPSFHGNYNESLKCVKSMIFDEYTKLAEDGVEHIDMPNFSIVFLSDGRPSDCTRADTEQRTTLLQNLTQLLSSKLLFYAMGVGANGADFGVLSSMVKIVNENGGEGQFVHAGLSAVALSSTFSDISNTLTTHRTTLLSSTKGGNNLPTDNAAGKTKKDFTMRETGKIVGKKMPVETYIHGKEYTIKRFRFENKGAQRFSWRDVKFANHGAIGFEKEIHPFGKGSERLAYRFSEVMFDKKTNIAKKTGKTMVAKTSIHIEKETKEDFHEDFCRVQSVSQDLAEKFNDAVRKAPSLAAADKATRPPELQFMLCHVYSYTNNVTKEEKALLVEKKLPGKFTKYNSNNGYVKGAKEGATDTRTIELECGKVPLEDFVQAFSHWVYVHSNHNLIVCDLQGVLNEEGRYPIFQLTDPAICTRKGPRYGKTDMKINGIRNFCRTHRCGLVCKGLGLKCIPSLLRDRRTIH